MSYQNLEHCLKEKGLRLTSARKSVYGALAGSSKALSAKELFEHIDSSQSEKTDLVSVYRNLDLFTELGIVHEVFSGKYSVCEQTHQGRSEHVHIVSVCTRCGVANELKEHEHSTCQISDSLKAESQYLRKVTSITLQGLCPECS